MDTVLNSLKAEGKTMVILDELNDMILTSSRNIPNLRAVTYNHVSVYDIMNTKTIIATENALKRLRRL